MRADVKLGLVISVVLVSIAGGYYAFRGNDDKPIPVNPTVQNSAKRPLKTAPPPTADNRSTKRATTPKRNARRGATTPRNANKGAARTAAQPRPVAARRPSQLSGSTPAKARPGAADARVADGATKPSSDRGVTRAPRRTTRPRINPRTAAKPASAPPRGDREVVANGASLPPSTPRRSALLAAPTPKPIEPADKRAASGAAAVDRHRVQPGDTMASLAERYYGTTTLAAFLTASNPRLANPSRLQRGQIVRIPPRPKSTAPAAPKKATPRVAHALPSKDVAKTYRVRPGDSFYKIAGAQLGSSTRWKELYELNKQRVGPDPGRLKVGQVLVLPGS